MLDDELIGINWELANDDAARWALAHAAEIVGQLKDVTRRRLRREIAAWIENGETLSALIDRLSPIFGPTRARLIAETETTRAFAEGNMAAWRSTGVIKKRKWNTANDELVCPICGPLNQTVVGMDEDFPGGVSNPPAHPRCRCWVTGVVVRDDG